MEIMQIGLVFEIIEETRVKGLGNIKSVDLELPLYKKDKMFPLFWHQQ
jgi:hypothetical protein